MSVPEPKRDEGKLEVCEKARELCQYTITITKNQNIFLPDFQTVLIDKINQLAIDIHVEVWTANNVLVRSPEHLKYRRRLQESAAIKCNTLLALIDLAKPMFHLSGKRVVFWSKKVIRVRSLIRGWRDSDAERYKQYRDVG